MNFQSYKGIELVDVSKQGLYTSVPLLDLRIMTLEELRGIGIVSY